MTFLDSYKYASKQANFLKFFKALQGLGGMFFKECCLDFLFRLENFALATRD